MTVINEMTDAVQIKDGIYWVGWPDRNAGFANNPYLIIEDDLKIIIDPGSGLDEHWALVKKKIESVIPLKEINMIIVQHQDPDLCGAIPHIEKELGVNNFDIVTSERAGLFVPYYNVRTEVTTIDDGEIIEIGENHELMFITTPYLHFPGAINTFDLKHKILFSSDIFGAFSVDWNLYANEHYPEAIKVFAEPYLSSKRHVLNYVNKIKKLDIDMICPQHGSIIKDNIPAFIKVLEELEVGVWT